MDVARLQQPIEFRVALAEGETATTGGPRQFRDGADDVTDQRSQTVGPCVLWQHAVLGRHEQLLRDQAAHVIELIAEKAPRRWIMQVHLVQRAFKPGVSEITCTVESLPSLV